MIATSPSPILHANYSNTSSPSHRNVWSRPHPPATAASSSIATSGSGGGLSVDTVAVSTAATVTAAQRFYSVRRRSAPTTPADMRRSSYSQLRSSSRQQQQQQQQQHEQQAAPIRVAPMRDAATQYSSPETPGSERSGKGSSKRKERAGDDNQDAMDDDPPIPRLTPQTHALVTPARGAGSPSTETTTVAPAIQSSTKIAPTNITATPSETPSKRARPEDPAPKIVPVNYEDCPTSELVPIIASMLMELIRHNDDMPVTNTGLTRFHSRAAPGISVQDYLQRLAHHATLSPPILLCMVYYIDRLCALWPKFTINSLTVHRYLITSATVASKGLSDSFWTNSTYARVGGVSLKELALLELEFLWRIEWRIVPKPEVLVDYYRSLVQRCQGFEIADSVEQQAQQQQQNNEDMVVDGDEK